MRTEFIASRLYAVHAPTSGSQNPGDSTVTKLRASDGSPLGTFTAGTRPVAAAFDGANIWIANQGSNDVTKLRASDGAVLGSFPVGQLPQAVIGEAEEEFVV